MLQKTYTNQGNILTGIEETLANCGTVDCKPDAWNPNLPFIGTQEEWREHFLQIEQGNFTPLEEANKEFELWKKEYLANRLN